MYVHHIGIYLYCVLTIVSASSIISSLDTGPAPPCPCTHHMGQQGVEMDCAGRDIVEIWASWFPDNLAKLYLGYNRISTLHNTTFLHLSQLVWLDLGSNVIEVIEPSTFQDLYRLEYLGLAGNRRLALSSLPAYLLSALTSLKTLTLPGMRDLEGHLGLPRGLCGLGNLTRLDIERDDDVEKRITKASFSELGCLNVVELNLSHISIELGGLEEDALSPVSRTLRSFTVINVFVGLQCALRSLKPLQFRNVTNIYFRAVGMSSTDPVPSIKTRDGIVDRESVVYLKNVCVDNLSLVNSDLIVLDITAFVPLSDFVKCLRYIDVSYNRLELSRPTILRLFNLPRIEIIIARLHDTHPKQYALPPDTANVVSRAQYRRSSNLKPRAQYRRSDNLKPRAQYRRFDNLKPRAQYRRSYNLAPRAQYRRFDSSVVVSVSKTLKVLIVDLNHGHNKMNDVTKFRNADNAEALICNDCGIYSATGSILGLGNIKILDFSHNDLFELSCGFLKNMPKIETLNLAHTNQNNVFMSLKSRELFEPFTKLKQLNLSSNSLTSLSGDTFKSNSRLEIISLADNKFSSIPFQLTLTPRLRLLDLRKNTISALSSQEMDELEQHVEEMDQFEVWMEDNTMSCGCDTLRFLVWLNTTDVILDKGGNYTCVTPDGHLSHTSMYTDGRAMWRRCSGKFFLWVSVVLLVVIVNGLLVTQLALRHGLYFRAVFYTMFTATFRTKSRDDYPINVFIGYAEQDYKFPCGQLMKFLETELGLNTYIRDRDSVPGEDAASAIMDAILSSWRIVLVISPAFLDTDQWAEFTMRSSVYSQNPRDPRRILVVATDDVIHRLPTHLLAAVADENVVSVEDMGMCYELTQKLKTFLN